MSLGKLTESDFEIIRPTRAEMDEGLAKIDKYLPHWRSNPALLLIKPHLGLIVAFQSLEYDEEGFVLTCQVDRPLLAPPDFDPATPIRLACACNQPYLSVANNLISAPYGFYLHFGTEGVQCARELPAAIRDAEQSSEGLLGLYRCCFSPDFREWVAQQHQGV